MFLDTSNAEPPTISQMLPGILIGFLVLVACFVYLAIYVFRFIRRIGDENDKNPKV